jgi:hypothetical protein
MTQIEQYHEFLKSKIKIAEKQGIEVSPELLHPSLRPDQRDIALFALSLGAGLIAPDAGMGKTRIAIEVMRILQYVFGGKCLIATELGAVETFVSEDPEVGEAAAMGLKLQYVTNMAELLASDCDICVTNWERIRMGSFDLSKLTGFWGDEGSYVKNMAGELTNYLQMELPKVRFKYFATATPSPNETLELVNYAHVLGICDRGQILTRFFQRNSTKAGELTLHPHHTDDFWLWVSTWCIAVTDPSDLGYNLPGFKLPKLNLHWVEVKTKPVEAGSDKDGQARMFVTSRSGLSEAAKIKRESIAARVANAMAIVAQHPDEHFILWHHLNTERDAINKAFEGVESFGFISGNTPEDIREKHVTDFTKGKLKYLSAKPDVCGVGCNFQKHCRKCIGVGITDSFEELYQYIKRILRFYSPFDEVDIYLQYTPEEYDIVLNLKRKWNEHDQMRAYIRDLVLEYGLDHKRQIEERKRSFMIERIEYKGENWKLVTTDAVYEWFKEVPDDSIDMIHSSFPFGNHFEYSAKYNDFGHNETNEAFIRQLMFLLPQLLRTLKPGRIAAIHLKNRIHYGSVTGLGFSTFHRFTHMVCDAMEKAGFHCMGFHYIPTDVVAENNQTYRLGYSEACKDMTKMGAGIPEEVWVFRKAPTSNANAYADEPVIHDKGEYSLSNWQLDADAFWRSSGNRYLTPRELKAWGIDKIQAWWKKHNSGTIYDYDEHVKLLQQLEDNGKLSRTFTTIPIRSNTPYVWNDVNRMQGLNMEQSRRRLQNHICPEPFDIVDRVIEQYSNPGDLIADPFGGLGTTGIRALKKGRRALLTELNDTYAKTAAMYLRETEIKVSLPTLFDVLTEPINQQ